jgi:hypothetical protein
MRCGRELPWREAGPPNHLDNKVGLDQVVNTELKRTVSFTALRDRRRANMARIRQSQPDTDLGYQVRVLNPFPDVPSSLGSGHQRGEGLSC